MATFQQLKQNIGMPGRISPKVGIILRTRLLTPLLALQMARLKISIPKE